MPAKQHSLEEKYDEIQQLIIVGKERGYLLFDEINELWKIQVSDGRDLTCRILILALGLLSQPTMPRIQGVEDFKGRSWHTYGWPHEEVDLSDQRVGIIGTGATAIQVIGEIADKVGDLTVFQRRPNWVAPLNNSDISVEQMEDIRERYDEIFETCARTRGGFEHEPDRRGFYEVNQEERYELWDRLYDESGFSIWLKNFREIFTDEEANAEREAAVIAINEEQSKGLFATSRVSDDGMIDPRDTRDVVGFALSAVENNAVKGTKEFGTWRM